MRAEQNPSLSIVAMIADALDLPLSDLFDCDRPSAAQTVLESKDRWLILTRHSCAP